MPLLTTAGTLAQKRNAAVARQVPTSSFFPLSNTSVDPTGVTWRANNFGYTFTPNVGITTAGPMTNASYMFFTNLTFNDPDVSLWDTSSITNMESMFASGRSGRDSNIFNQSLASWDVSNVTNMSSMFLGCANYNQPMNNWNTGSVVTMQYMFTYCQSFNQNIGSWNTRSVTNMGDMFANCRLFNCGQASGVAHDLMQRTATGGWRVDSVVPTTNGGMEFMFQSCEAFNGNLSNWCVTNIPSYPTFFALGANANFTTARQPTWGACPFPG